MSFNFFSFFTLACRAGNVNHLDQLVTMSMIPTAILALLFFIYLLLRPCGKKKRTLCCNCGKEQSRLQKLARLRQIVFALSLEIMFLVQPMVSSQLALSYHCVTYGDTAYLAADLRISCSSKEYQLLVFYSSLMVLFFPIGVPLFYFVTLFRYGSTIVRRWLVFVEALTC